MAFRIFCDGVLCRKMAIAHARAQASDKIGEDLVAKVSDTDIEAKAAQPLSEVSQPYTLGHGFIIHELEDAVQWISDHKTQIAEVVSVILTIAALIPK